MTLLTCALPSPLPGQGACFEAGLRRGAQAEGGAGIRDICWEHVERGQTRENESVVRVGKTEEGAGAVSGRGVAVWPC